MQNTDLKAIQSIAETNMGAYYISTVIEKAGYLLNSLEAPQLTQLITDLLFYVSNPECAKDLSKEDFMCLTNDSLSLVNMLTDLRSTYTDFVEQIKM